MEGFNELPFWRADKEKICERIRSRRATLKIVVKAKDEKHFLRDWIAYHSAIVGHENLIVFDNMSSDPTVETIYTQLPKETVLVRYDGFHNNIHNKEIFASLYAALAESCRYFLFIDTDEFLTFIDNDKMVLPQSIVDFLADCEPIDAYPGTWLYDAPLSRFLFRCGSIGELDGGLRWGKPILRSAARMSGTLLHNSEISSSFYGASTPLRFFILHMLNLYPDQRIAVNLRKMVARGLIRPDDTVEAVLARDWTKIEDNIVKVYVSELRAFTEAAITSPSYGSKGLIKIEPNSRVGFPSPYEEGVFDAFRSNGPAGAISRVLIS
jgi:Glycosyl transferase family 2